MKFNCKGELGEGGWGSYGKQLACLGCLPGVVVVLCGGQGQHRQASIGSPWERCEGENPPSSLQCNAIHSMGGPGVLVWTGHWDPQQLGVLQHGQCLPLSSHEPLNYKRPIGYERLPEDVWLLSRRSAVRGDTRQMVVLESGPFCG